MKKLTILFLAATITIVGCQDNKQQKAETGQNNQIADHQIHQSETENEWVSLLNEDNLEGWKAYNDDDEITKWRVEDGVLIFDPAQAGGSGSENLITEDTYTSFELSLEWKISEGGNSGIMWAVQEEEQFGEPYLTGPEIQILDNERHPDADNGPNRHSGALYDMVEPSSEVTNPAGEWNEMTISIDYEQNQGSVHMNGTRIVEFPVHGEEWNAMVEDSKFSDWEDFGKYKTGHIALQDHGNKVWFRNIKIRELN